MNCRRSVSASSCRTSCRRMLQAEPVRQRLMRLLGDGEIAEQLARLGIARALRRLDVEALRVGLHLLGLRPHLVDAERAHQPVRLALVIAADMLAADQRDALAEALRDAARSGGGGGRLPRPPSRRTPSPTAETRSRMPSA